jgi:hypothetical protein
MAFKSAGEIMDRGEPRARWDCTRFIIIFPGVAATVFRARSV